jgi:hypothetical protein
VNVQSGAVVQVEDDTPLPDVDYPPPTLSREAFCVALIGAGILTEAEAIKTELGAWPPAFDAFLNGKDLLDRIGAKNQWSDAQTIMRDGAIVTDLLAYLARSDGLSPDQITAVKTKIFTQQDSRALD